MATLFGTTASGESLPVQVNEFGQLVAQGLPGPQGEQGEQGPIGPPGDFQFSTGTWTPEFKSDDPSGAGFLSYDVQDGYWYLFGPLLTVSWYVRTTNVALTDIRGSALVAGLPPEIGFATPSISSQYVPSSFNTLKTEARGTADSGRYIYDPELNGFFPFGVWSGAHAVSLWADLDSPNGTTNVSVGSFSGLLSGTVKSVRFELDDLV